MPDIKLLTDRDARIVDGKFQYNDGEKWVETQKAYKTYGVKIALGDSSSTNISYIGDASGMTPGSLDWDNTPIFQNIRPCIVSKSNYVSPNFISFKKYLDPRDFTKFADGSDATPYIQGDKNDYENGIYYDVFIEIPKLGIKISKDSDSGYGSMTVQITNDPAALGFSYKAHSEVTEGDCNYIYVGAFLANEDSQAGLLCSRANTMPLVSEVLPTYRGLAGSNVSACGTYGILNFYTVTLLQCLYLIRYRSRDSQTALGMGYVGDTDWAVMAKPTGATVDKGMYYGSQDPMEQMKFMGIEDFWGNLYQWVDGLVSTMDFHALTCHIPSKMNDYGEGYDDLGQIMTSYVGGYMKEPQGTNDLGFIPKVCGGSATTYFADCAYFDAGYVPIFGGSFDGGSSAGAFQLNVGYLPGDASDDLGGRLMLVASTDIEEIDSFETE